MMFFLLTAEIALIFQFNSQLLPKTTLKT